MQGRRVGHHARRRKGRRAEGGNILVVWADRQAKSFTEVLAPGVASHQSGGHVNLTEASPGQGSVTQSASRPGSLLHESLLDGRSSGSCQSRGAPASFVGSPQLWCWKFLLHAWSFCTEAWSNVRCGCCHCALNMEVKVKVDVEEDAARLALWTTTRATVHSLSPSTFTMLSPPASDSRQYLTDQGCTG